MNRKGKTVCALLLVQLLAWGVFVPTADAGKLVRLAAQSRQWGGSWDSTSTAPAGGGVVIYTKSFTIPAPKAGQQAVVFVGMAAAIEQDAGPFITFKCEIDGNPCNSGSRSGLPAGWIYLQNSAVNTHFAGVAYTWCAKVSSGAHTATVRMASSDGTNVYLTTAHFFIDRTELKASTADDCETGTP